MSDSPQFNVKKVVPFLHVADMTRSFHFYVDGLGFEKKREWVVDGKLRWCWLTLGGASIMLQEFRKGEEASVPAAGRRTRHISLAFQCEDAIAIYHEARSRGLEASEPEVGNSMWVTTVSDPDGFLVEFASLTDVPEETLLSQWKPSAV